MFALSAETRRFIGLSLSVWTLAANGSTFAFSLYSAQLKEKFNFSQQQLNIVVLFGMVGYNLGMPSGWLFDRIGPKTTAFASVLTNAGWLLLALAFGGNPHVPSSLPALCFYYFCITFATCFSNTGGLLGALQNFKKDAGIIVLIAESFVGLGATIYTNYYNAFFYPNVDNFFYFSAYSNAVIFILAGLITPSDTELIEKVEVESGDDEDNGDVNAASSDNNNQSPTNNVVPHRLVRVDERPASKARFAMPIFAYVCMVVFIIGMCVYQAIFQCVEDYVYRDMGIGTLVIMALFFLTPFIPVNCCEQLFRRKNSEHHGTTTKETSVLLSTNQTGSTLSDDERDQDTHVVTYSRQSTRLSERPANPLAVVESAHHHQCRRLRVTTSAELKDSVKTLNLWLLLWVVFVCIGVTSAIIFNATQIYQALDWADFDPRTNTIYVCIVGIGSCFGRIIVGIGTEKVKRSTTLLLLAPATLAIVLLAMLFVPPYYSLLFSFLFGAVAFGISWSAIAVLSGDLFGTENLGIHYNFISFAPLFSAVFINILLFSKVYDRTAHAQGTYPNCYVRGCVQTTLYVMLGLVVSAFVAAGFLHHRAKSMLVDRVADTSSSSPPDNVADDCVV